MTDSQVVARLFGTLDRDSSLELWHISVNASHPLNNSGKGTRWGVHNVESYDVNGKTRWKMDGKNITARAHVRGSPNPYVVECLVGCAMQLDCLSVRHFFFTTVKIQPTDMTVFPLPEQHPLVEEEESYRGRRRRSRRSSRRRRSRRSSLSRRRRRSRRSSSSRRRRSPRRSPRRFRSGKAAAVEAVEAVEAVDLKTPEIGYYPASLRNRETFYEFKPVSNLTKMKESVFITFGTTESITNDHDQICETVLSAVTTGKRHDVHWMRQNGSPDHDRKVMLLKDLSDNKFLKNNIAAAARTVYMNYVVSLLEVDRVSALFSTIDFRPLKDLLYTGCLRFCWHNDIPYALEVAGTANQKSYLDALVGQYRPPEGVDVASPAPARRDFDNAPGAPRVP